MAVTTYPEFERFYDLKNEKNVLEELLEEITDEDVFYDIGANVGLYSCFAGSKSPEGSVYSFEPHPVNVDALKKNLQLNDVDGTIFQMALSDEEGTFELSSEGSEAGLGEHSLNTTQSESTVSVTVRQLDSLRTEHDIPVPTIIKIDVEGAELDVLKGATETLSEPNCKTIYCEIHPGRIKAFGGSSEALRDHLSELGFEIEDLDREMGGRVMIKATK
ncbi:FkbM family methyltransferase [Natrialbaceae archaeon A-chndr2]